MEQASSDFDSSFESLFACGYRAAYRLVGNRSDAEDLAIEAVARAQVRWDQVGPYGPAFVVRTAANLALDLLRRGAPPQSAVVPAEPDLSVEHRIDLVESLRRLPRRQREVVLLRYIGDRSEREVADVLGISAGSVKQHASRGLAAMRTSLDGYRSPIPSEEVDDVH